MLALKSDLIPPSHAIDEIKDEKKIYSMSIMHLWVSAHIKVRLILLLRSNQEPRQDYISGYVIC